jgi:hypothetical protein
LKTSFAFCSPMLYLMFAGSDPSRHFRAGLLFMPSLRGLASFPDPLPALPCRPIVYAVPSGLASFPDPSRHFRAGLLFMPSLRDSYRSRIPSRHFRAGLLIMPSLRDSYHRTRRKGTPRDVTDTSSRALRLVMGSFRSGKRPVCHFFLRKTKNEPQQ